MKIAFSESDQEKIDEQNTDRVFYIAAAIASVAAACATFDTNWRFLFVAVAVFAGLLSIAFGVTGPLIRIRYDTYNIRKALFYKAQE